MGTGGSAGYIDDELPDYVMIMVANKRSKSQMIEDLKLFLGTNTEVFVVWLHQVLEKLHEVTLPVAATVHKNKRKTHDVNNVPTKKEKKERKKDKKRAKDTTTPDIITKTVAETAPPIIPSITDVLAEQMIKKAKETLETTENVAKSEVKSEEKAKSTTGNEFDIPTIAEMSETAKSREKDLQELDELQKKINRAKRQLRAIDSDKESEDEDFLNLKDDDSQVEFGEEEPVAEKNVRRRSPIIFDKNSANESVKRNKPDSKSSESKIESRKSKLKPSILERLSKEPDSQKEKVPIEDKKSDKNKICLSAVRRAEKEIYVAGSYNKKLEERKGKKSVEIVEKRRVKERVREGRVREEKPPSKLKRQKIESRVIVARSIKIEADDEEEIDVPVNSVVKIKPRPSIPAHKQASKNLLLRAVAEAQKSTALASSRSKSSISLLTPKPIKKFEQKKKTIKSNIIIQIPTDITNVNNTSESDEYIPQPSKSTQNESSSNNAMIYIPRSINLRHRIDIRDKISNKDSRTQFVVTLDGRYENNKKSSTPPLVKQRSSSQDKKSKSIITKVVNDLSTKIASEEESVSPEEDEIPPPVRSRKWAKSVSAEKEEEKEKVSSKQQPLIEKTTESVKPVLKASKRNLLTIASNPTIPRFIIKTNDTTDDEKDLDKSLSPPKEKIRRQRSKVSPIKFDIDKKIDAISRPQSSESLNKYENIPPRKTVLFKNFDFEK